MDQPIIQIRNLSKQYRLGQKVVFDTFREKIGNVFHTNRQKLVPDQKNINALIDLDLDIMPGEVLGIIGFNGSGKSTLLKLISRITPPSNGEIVIRGSVSSLLDIGLGFHPDLTGRENIFLNGAILGMKRSEIISKFNDIVEFSGIEQKFLDTPVKRYSTGMYVRLGFSIAAHLNSDILLIDEVLAVGDYKFQNKCLDKIDSITKSQRTVLFVSHNLAAIERLCQRTIVINKGQKVFDGQTTDAITFYFNLQKSQALTGDLLTDNVIRSGSGQVRFQKIEILDEQKQPISKITTGSNFYIKIVLDARQTIENLRVALLIKTRLGQTLSRLYNIDDQQIITQIENKETVYCHIRNFPLLAGDYYLDLWIADKFQVHDFIEHAYDLSVQNPDQAMYQAGSGNVLIPCEWEFGQ